MLEKGSSVLDYARSLKSTEREKIASTRTTKKSYGLEKDQINQMKANINNASMKIPILKASETSAPTIAIEVDEAEYKTLKGRVAAVITFVMDCLDLDKSKSDTAKVLGNYLIVFNKTVDTPLTLDSLLVNVDTWVSVHGSFYRSVMYPEDDVIEEGTRTKKTALSYKLGKLFVESFKKTTTVQTLANLKKLAAGFLYSPKPDISYVLLEKEYFSAVAFSLGLYSKESSNLINAVMAMRTPAADPTLNVVGVCREALKGKKLKDPHLCGLTSVLTASMAINYTVRDKNANATEEQKSAQVVIISNAAISLQYILVNCGNLMGSFEFYRLDRISNNIMKNYCKILLYHSLVDVRSFDDGVTKRAPMAKYYAALLNWTNVVMDPRAFNSGLKYKPKESLRVDQDTLKAMKPLERANVLATYPLDNMQLQILPALKNYNPITENQINAYLAAFESVAFKPTEYLKVANLPQGQSTEVYTHWEKKGTKVEVAKTSVEAFGVPQNMPQLQLEKRRPEIQKRSVTPNPFVSKKKE